MQFRDIVGQAEIKQHMLRTLVQEQVPHAQLFYGMAGVGKLPLALAYAQYLNCEHPTEQDSCGRCRACQKTEQLIHPDLHFVFPIVKKDKKNTCDDYLSLWRKQIHSNPYFSYQDWLNTIQVGNMQGLIYEKESEEVVRKLSLKHYEGRWKVVIIWQAEKLHLSAANSLLKILEEPSEHTAFILVSNHSQMILPTIQSRCRRIHVKPISSKDIANNLEANFSVSADKAVQIAHIARGSFTKALEALHESPEQRFFFQLFVQTMRVSYARNVKKIKETAEELARLGREKQKGFLDYCQVMIREYFVNNVKQPELVYLNEEEAQFGVKFSPFINEKNIEDFMQELTTATLHIEQNVNAKMVFFDLCLKITILIKR